MTLATPLIQLAENCVVCAHPLHAQERPEGLRPLKAGKIVVTHVHVDCVKFLKNALTESTRMQNAINFIAAVAPRIAAEQQRLDSQLVPRAAKARRKELRIARNRAHDEWYKQREELRVAMISLERDPESETLKAQAADLEGRYSEAWYPYVEAEQALYAEFPDEEPREPYALSNVSA